MPNILTRALLGAAIIFLPHAAGAAPIFENDFTSGIGGQEDVIGNFSVADGYLGHHGGCANTEYSSYRIVLDLAGITNAFLDFDFTIASERGFDFLQVRANDQLLGGYTGLGGGHARYALGMLTDPEVVGRSVISFDFTSDFAITDAGVRIDNVAITGDRATAPVGDVPELASWAMMVVGFGMLGGALRTRRFTTSASMAAL